MLISGKYFEKCNQFLARHLVVYSVKRVKCFMQYHSHDLNKLLQMPAALVYMQIFECLEEFHPLDLEIVFTTANLSTGLYMYVYVLLTVHLEIRGIFTNLVTYILRKER